MDVHTVPNPAKSLLGFRPLSNDEEDELPESDIESSDGGSENGNASDLQIDPEKMDPAHREFLVKLKRQEREERAEIERELQAHKEALARRSAELRAQQQQRENINQDLNQGEDLSINHRNKHSAHSESGRDSPSSDDGIRPQRPDSIGLLAHHGGVSLKATDKANNMDALAQAYGLDRGFPPHSPPGPDQDSMGTPSHHWTFEEQFKQLYELNDDPKRREFLDELFAFMQKRGTPVNRIPIMAKQTLDLYELFKLVVSKGGLVEVINKKLWREITKGLHLPSSITSAAFTLRTQYMKYLYPYECEKLKLSSPQELQSAIDGNRREGRRPSYGGFDMSPGPTLLPQSPHLNGSMMNGRPPTESRPYNIFDAYRVSPLFLRPLWDLNRPTEKPNHNHSDDEGSRPSSPNLTPRSLMERDALAMEAASRAMEDATRKLEASRANLIVKPHEDSPPRKRMAFTEENRLIAHAGLPGAHLKLTSKGDGRAEFDNSLVVSIEVNGIMYQGVLFAQTAVTANSQRRI